MHNIIEIRKQSQSLLYSLILLKKFCENLHDSEEFEIINNAIRNVTNLADKLNHSLNVEEE